MRSKHLWSDPVALAAIYDQTEVRSKPVLIRLKCARNSQIRDKILLMKKSPSFALIYSFHKN